MASGSKRRLGKGLDALIPSTPETPGLRKVSVDAIVPNPLQPRSVFDEESCRNLRLLFARWD